MTRAKDISKILTDADLSGTLDVTGAFTSQGIDDNADATAITIDSSERVGIGTASPAHKVHIADATTPELIVEDTTNNVKAVIGADNSVGRIGTDTNHPVTFRTNDTERVRIDASGNLLVGKTSSDTGATAGFEWYDAGNALFITRSGNPTLEANRLSSDGAIANFRKDGTIVGSIGSLSGFTYLGSGDTGMLFVSSDETIRPHNTTTNAARDNAISLGEATVRWKDLYLSGGVFSNTLSVGTSSTNGALTITGSIVARETDGQFEIISRDTSGSSATDYGDIIFKGQRSVDGDTSTIMTLDGALGNVFVGTTTFNGDNAKFTVRGAGSNNGGVIEIQHTRDSGSNRDFIRFYNETGGEAGGIEHTSSTGVSYQTTSDYRLKENVTYDFDATSRLKQLKPCRFNFIADTDTTIDGFLAHEVSGVVPEAIGGEKDAVDKDGKIIPQGIDQSKLVPLLVKTIQELEARIAALETA